ncbi:hypothetical protein LIER_13579 [Lithospermum erythrorhizon]|uniref:Reverse transcriptase/retrotransposon-derived protein RNase H-like domain-containing protein n=1 Tax=Lithospermum erythrorhizon TaxID=34254 RepID=A0AAV3Q037_LITER
MCTNFTSLNKVCPKDFYPLPCLARLVDGSAGHEVFDFMDASRGSENMENLREILEQLRKSKLRINTDKCSFGVTSGKFLGYMISERGIEPNPDKIKAILDMQPPREYKDIQKLIGCLAALSRFIFKSGEKNLPFFKNLRRASSTKFYWDDECNKAFERLKEYLSSPKLLSQPEQREILQLYLVVSNGAVSSVLIRKDEGQQIPVYYVSRILHRAEESYPIIDKFALDLVISARKLKIYFVTSDSSSGGSTHEESHYESPTIREINNLGYRVERV